MKGLRSTDDVPAVSTHLGRMTLNQRTRRYTGQLGERIEPSALSKTPTAVGKATTGSMTGGTQAVRAGDDQDTDLLEDAEQRVSSAMDYGKDALAGTARTSVKELGQAARSGQHRTTRAHVRGAADERSARPSATTSGQRSDMAARSAATHGEVLGRAEGRTRSALGRKAVRGRLISAGKRGRTAKRSATGTQSVVSTLSRSTKGAADTTKAVIQASGFTGRLVAALASAFSSTTVIAVAAVVVAAIAAVVAIASIIPSIGNQTASTVPAAGVPPQYADAVNKAGAICPEISPALIAAQINAESGWNPNARSGAGAEGISQFMPATWAAVGKDGDGNGTVDIWSPGDAIVTQGSYMCSLVAAVKTDVAGHTISGDVASLALAAYNAGLGAVEAAHGIPSITETTNYVASIIAAAGGYTAVAQTAATGDTASAISWAEQIAQDNSNAYVWGGNGPAAGGYDCSGLTQAFMARLGVSLPRTAADQSQIGHQVSAAQAQPGDLIFWGDPAYHVAIYIGGGQMVSADNEQDGINVENVYGAPTQYRSYR